MSRLPRRRELLRALTPLAAAAVFVLTLTTAIHSQQPSPQVPAGAPDPQAVARGRSIFLTNCAACHGPDGRGGEGGGVDLARSPIAAADDGGRQLIAFLKVGRPERRMPAFGLSDAEATDIHAFIRSLARGGRDGVGRGAIEALVVGNAAAGEAYFKGEGGCTRCHSATGDLKGIGSRLPVAAIQGRIVMPRGDGGYPRSFNSPPDPSEPQRTVTIVQPSGERLSGTLLWITDFYVTFADASGTRRTVARNGNVPKVEVTDPLQYHIDHMKRLTDKVMHDLTAYLVTLK